MLTVEVVLLRTRAPPLPGRHLAARQISVGERSGGIRAGPSPSRPMGNWSVGAGSPGGSRALRRPAGNVRNSGPESRLRDYNALGGRSLGSRPELLSYSQMTCFSFWNGRGRGIHDEALFFDFDLGLGIDRERNFQGVYEAWFEMLH